MDRAVRAIVVVTLHACGRIGIDPRGDGGGAPRCIAHTSASDSHTCALRGDGTIACWGDNTAGQLGNGTLESSTIPMDVLAAPGGSPFMHADQISSGVGFTTCAHDKDDAAWCWGANDFGQVGDGGVADRTTPTRVITADGSPLLDVEEVITGEWHACARRADDTLWCWGRNDFGQLGNGTLVESHVPVQVVTSSLAPLEPVKGFMVSLAHTCAWLVGGDLYCWGSNASGQLGDGTTTDRTTATSIMPGVTAAVSALGHTCALADGVMSCFGSNSDGQLGDGTMTSRPSAAPVVVSLGGPALPGIIAIGAGDGHSCALQNSGLVWCWGANDRLQLGAGTSTPTRSLIPVRVGLTASAVELAVGNGHACAMLEDNSVLCWGWNQFGQLGLGTTNDTAVPLVVDLGCS